MVIQNNIQLNSSLNPTHTHIVKSCYYILAEFSNIANLMKKYF